MYKQLLFILLFAMTSMTARAANDLNSIQALLQSQFSALSEDLSAGLSYKGSASAAPAGVAGFEIGLDVTAVQVANNQAWKLATSGSNIDTVPVPKLYASKGLPANLDIEGFYTEIPNSNISLWGGAAKYSFLEGSAATPALAIRGGLTQLNGVDQLDMSSTSIELLVSKEFLNITPYAGIGQVWSSIDPKGIPLLKSEDVSQTKFFAGANISLLLIKLGIYADQTGDTTSYGLRIGVGL